MAHQTASDPRADARTPGPVPSSDGRARGVASRLRRYADRPWASGLAGFTTTVLVMLPIEYEAPLRTFMLFLSTRRSW